MKIVNDAARVLKISWSFWCNIFGLLSLILPEIIFATTGTDFSPFIRFLMPIGFFTAAAVLRLVEQPDGALSNWLRLIGVALVVVVLAVFAGVSMGRAGELSGPKMVAVEDAPKLTAREQLQADTLVIATPFIAKWEGFRSCPYIPIKGDVPTIGYGSTRGITMQTPCITKEQGIALLDHEVREYMVEFNNRMPQGAWAHLVAHSNAAFTDLAFNVGWTGAATSTAIKRMAEGNVSGACTALTWWNKSGGRVIVGLVNRRSNAEKLCLGLSV